MGHTQQTTCLDLTNYILCYFK